jgi:hypothetical protein
LQLFFLTHYRTLSEGQPAFADCIQYKSANLGENLSPCIDLLENFVRAAQECGAVTAERGM